MFAKDAEAIIEANCGHRDVDVSVVVLTWNARRFITECLASLLAAKRSSSMEVIVVDNASSDGTPDLVEREFPGARLIKNGQNLGFAKGNNVGISLCRGKYICLVNADVNVPPECISNLWDYMENHPDVGMVGPRLLTWDGKPGRSTMRFLTLQNLFCRAIALDRIFSRSRAFGGYLMSDCQSREPVDVDVLNGWFWMVRREALVEVGVLDRRFFMYGEDIDWSYRFHQAGWRVVLYPGAEAIHYGGGCSEGAQVRFSVERERANLQYWQKYHGRVSTAAYRAVCGLNLFLRMSGHAVLALISARNRASAILKRNKSAAGLRWLITL